MKIATLIFLLITLIFSNFQATAQHPIDTSGGRYLLPIFDSIITQRDVVYAQGLYANGNVSDLKLDVYQPFGDTVSQRPVIVLAHGGGFIQGNKAEMEYACKQFARRGYVTVTIQYRLGYSSLTTNAIIEMVIRATQDMKNSIRFLRKSVVNGNAWRLHPDLIFAGGFSAGAITALHVGYLDKLSEVPPGQAISTEDSLHNSGQIPGFDWKPKAVINIAGALGDTNWMQNGDLPVISFHGTSDATVPYISGQFGFPFGASISLFGSFSVQQRAQNLGLKSELRSFQNAGHDYTLTYAWAQDTTENRIARFLFPLLVSPVTHLSSSISAIDFQITNSQNAWILKSKNEAITITTWDLQGRILSQHYVAPFTELHLPKRSVPVLLHITDNQNERPASLLLPSAF